MIKCKGYYVPDGYMGYTRGKYQLFENRKGLSRISFNGGRDMNGMIEDQIREIKDNLCVNCGDRICCHGIQSCKDANEYITKGSGEK